MFNSETNTRLSLRIHPNVARNEVVGMVEGVLRIKIAAPPDKGKANRKLISFLSKCLNVSKDHLDIVSGLTSRNKVIAIEGLDREEALKRLLPG
ncbi:DUF167 domain-containing protein [Chloroflexota bacterium]